jgi:hypothetical protein
MEHITLLPRIYGPHRRQLFDTLKFEIDALFWELDVAINKITTNRRGQLTIDMKGSDEEFAANLLQQEFGLAPELDDLTIGEHYSGLLVDVGKVGYGLYVDMGITKPEIIDALIPLHLLRTQVKMEKKPLREIARSLVLVDNFPVDIELIEVNAKKNQIEASLSTKFLERLERWTNDDHERLIVLGATRIMIDTALSRKHHQEDIYRIERLGIFEYALRCKRSTRASGILAAIGPILNGIPMHLFIPKEVNINRNATA